MGNAFDAMMGNGVGDVQIVGDRVLQVAEVDKPATYLNDGKFTAQDRIDLGFTPDQAGGGTTLAPGASLEFQAQCTTPFKPEQLIIDSAQAGDLTILQITANSVMYIDGAPVPATGYSEVSTATRVSWGTIQTSGLVKITVRNDGAAAFAVRMSLRGLRLRGQ
jgi:hypothetical protein